MAGPLIDLKCRQGCSGILGRAHLEGDSIVEEKCKHCGEWTIFKATPKETTLVPDNMGGFWTVPVVDGRLKVVQ